MSVAPIMIIGLIMTAVVRIIGSFMGIGIGTLVIQVCVGGGVYLSILAIYLFLFKDEMWVYLSKMIKISL